MLNTDQTHGDSQMSKLLLHQFNLGCVLLIGRVPLPTPPGGLSAVILTEVKYPRSLY